MHSQIQNNKLQILGKLSAGLTHEIRNPLSALRLNLDYLSISSEEFGDEAQEAIKACLEAVERISSMVENVLEFSRKATTERSLHSLNEVILAGVGIMAPAAAMKSVHLSTDLNSEIPETHFNRNKVLQVLINLLTNSIEACDKGGKIKIKSACEDAFITFKVQDNGCGIDDCNKEKIFSDFYTNKKNGTGLGLSVSKTLIEEQGGSITYKSSPGKGTTFSVTLPIKLNEEKK